MAIIKCKTCGGDVELDEGVTVGICQTCGATVTLPGADGGRRTAEGPAAAANRAADGRFPGRHRGGRA